MSEYSTFSPLHSENSAESPHTPFLMDKNNAQAPLTIPHTIALQDDVEIKKETTIIVKRGKTNIERLLLILAILILIATIIILILVVIRLPPKGNTTVTSNRKVVFIIADGISADTLESLPVPNIRKIQETGRYKRAYVGGDIGTYSQTVTISAPGYMNLITGTWGNKHNVYDNSVNNPNYNYKNIFRLVKEQQPTKTIAIFSTWITNRIRLVGEGLTSAGNLMFNYKYDGYELDLNTYPHDSNSLYIYNIDERVVNETAECIRDNGPDVSWVYLQYTDDIGHKYGDSEQMNQAVEYVDQQVGRIYEAIQYRQANHKEEWLLILTTDHGRDANTGQNHGAQTERERTTWIVTNYHDTNRYFDEYQPAIVDFMPTMMRFLKLEIPTESEKELDGVPLIGQVSLVKPQVNLSGSTLSVRWKSLDNAGNVKVWLTTTNAYKKGLTDDYKLLGTVPVTNQQAVFNITQYQSNFYKIVLEGKYNTVNKWIV
ncbi:unnamed protein product [Adineta ricciae]|uniref:Nucleotide pyrophosphatase n=1 Tax=Adineta ricciae TaxID=249248 RepID=A0A814MMZ9_ADIRI|nr:unnamed protein product [Adineta ricciae]CAF1371278.1 unnamed protein product [Adineta ricciae]